MSETEQPYDFVALWLELDALAGQYQADGERFLAKIEEIAAAFSDAAETWNIETEEHDGGQHADDC